MVPMGECRSMSLSQSMVSVKRVWRRLFLRASSRHIPSLRSLSSTMVRLNRSLCPSGRNPPPKFASSALFALPGIRESRRPETQQLHFPKRPFWHALMWKFSLTQTGSQRAKNIFRVTPAWAPASHELCPKVRLGF